MSGKDLFDGMSLIDERYIDEAENARLPRRMDSPWLRMAACLCLVLLSLWCIQPLLNSSHGLPPETTFPYAPEGLMEVIVYVEEMTDDGFTGTVAELVTPDLFEPGMELNVVIAEAAHYERADGSFGIIADNGIDFSGCHVLVVCIEYDPAAGAVVTDYISEVQSPEATP